jgi:glucokinase
MAGQGIGPPVVGIDLGGTKVLAGVVDGDGTILGRAKRSTPAQEGGEAILQAILQCMDEALDRARIGLGEVAAVGVGSPGPLDPESGVILFSANMNVKNFALGPELMRIVGRPVLLQNDVRVGGYGEFRLGVGRGYRDVIAAFVGTGIGGCIIMGGQVVTGSTGNAGEIGHIVIKSSGPKCGCGQRGCMEALASRTAITRRIAKAVRKGEPTVLAERILKRSGQLKSGDLAAAVAVGDAVAVRETHRAAHFLGIGLGGLMNVLGPELVIVGGGVAGALGDPWVDWVRLAARRHCLVDPHRRIKIERAALGDDAGILGASLLARERFLVG